MAGVVLPALLAGLTMLLVIYNRPGFTGERIKNPDSYSLHILRMNGTDSHTLSLNAGDVLQVEFETSKGSLHIKITAPDGTIIYAGNGEETTSFEINIPETGPYTVAVQARHAEGRIHIGSKHRDPRLHEPLNSNKSEMAL